MDANKLDTLKVRIQGTPDFKPEHYNVIDRTNPSTGDVLGTKFILKNKPLGVNHVFIFPDLDGKQSAHTELEFSSKVHGANYFDGNTVDTIERAINTINDSCGLALSFNKVLDSGIVCRADFFTDLHLTKPIPEYVKTLRATIPARDDFVMDKIKNESVMITRRKLTKPLRHRTIFYDKVADLRKAKNKNLRTVLTIPSSSVFRMETNATYFPQIRNWIGQEKGEPLLSKVLTTSRNVSLDVFDSLFPHPDTVIETAPQIIGETLREQKENALYLQWVQSYGTDLNKIMEHVRTVQGMNWTREKNKLIKFLNRLKGKQGQVREHALISEIRSYLEKVA